MITKCKNGVEWWVKWVKSLFKIARQSVNNTINDSIVKRVKLQFFRRNFYFLQGTTIVKLISDNLMCKLNYNYKLYNWLTGIRFYRNNKHNLF